MFILLNDYIYIENVIHFLFEVTHIPKWTSVSCLYPEETTLSTVCGKFKILLVSSG